MVIIGSDGLCYASGPTNSLKPYEYFTVRIHRMGYDRVSYQSYWYAL